MKNYTDLRIIVDRSGSMSSIAKDMLGGLRQFVEQRRILKEDTKVSYYLFDDKYDTIFTEKDVADIKDEDFTLVPRGWTALLDAVGKTINTVGEELTAKQEVDRPNRVLFMIITDGEDNRSVEFSVDRIREMIKHQREVYAWDFVFLGANIDSFSTAGRMAIGANSTRNFIPTSKGIAEAFVGMTQAYSNYAVLDRSDLATRSSTFSFDEEEGTV
jgi:hypothetical protein